MNRSPSPSPSDRPADGSPGRTRRDDAFARLLDDALRADVAPAGGPTGVAGGAGIAGTAGVRRRDTRRAEPLRVDVAPEVMRRLGFRPCSVAEKRRMRAGRALRRAAVLAVVGVAAVVGITLHNAGSSTATAPAVTIPAGIERGLIRQGERLEKLLDEFHSLLGVTPPGHAASPGVDGSEASAVAEDAAPPTDADLPHLETIDRPVDREAASDSPPAPIRRAVAPGRWT